MRAARNINWIRQLQLLCICLCLALPMETPAFGILDCNGNDIGDATEIAENPELDCNNNGMLDICEMTGNLIATGFPELVDKALFTGIVYELNPLNGQVADIAFSTTEEVFYADIAINPTNGDIITVELLVAAGKLAGQRMFKVDKAAGTLTPLTNLIVDAYVLGLAFGPDGRLYGTAVGMQEQTPDQAKSLGITGDRLVRLDPVNGGILETLQTDILVLGLATSPDGVIYSLGFNEAEPLLYIGDTLLRTHHPDTGAVLTELALTAGSTDFFVENLYGIGFAANGVLYAIGTTSGSQTGIYGTDIFSINTTSGVVTRVSYSNQFLTGLGGSLGGANDCNKNGIPDECDLALALGACPDAISVQATDETGLTIDYPALPEAENGCNPVVTVDPPSGTLFPIGTTPVTVTATDDAGAEVSCTFDVTILAPDAPAEQPTPGSPPPFCALFLFQSTCGIPLCGPCFLAGMINTFIGILGLRWYVRRRYARRR